MVKFFTVFEKKYFGRLIKASVPQCGTVERDHELGHFYVECLLPRDGGGVGLRGLGGEGGGSFTCRDDLIEFLTVIIATCSIGHTAAANFLHVLPYVLGDDGMVERDHELGHFYVECLLPRDGGGVGLRGLEGEGNGGNFTSRGDLIEFLTVIIATCSIGHAAANFLQYNEYGWIPNYAGTLFGEPPRDKVTFTLIPIYQNFSWLR